MTLGAITEILHLFISKYNASMIVHDRGGSEHEQEEIEVIEMPLEGAYK